MSRVRTTFLLFGLTSFLGGAWQLAPAPMAPPWMRLEHDVRQTLAMGAGVSPIRVDLRQSCAMLEQAGLATGVH